VEEEEARSMEKPGKSEAWKQTRMQGKGGTAFKPRKTKGGHKKKITLFVMLHGREEKKKKGVVKGGLVET